MKVRQNLYLDRELSDALEALATGPGANKSRLVNDAIAAWLARRGGAIGVYMMAVPLGSEPDGEAGS